MMLRLMDCNSTAGGYLRFVRIVRYPLGNHVYRYTHIADVLLLNSHTKKIAQPFQFDGYELSIEIKNTQPSCVIMVDFERTIDLLNIMSNNAKVPRNLIMVREIYLSS